MFKRANKITSLLVAAAAVVSLVPVTGVNAAEVKKVDSQDGIIYNAVAYKDGSALIDGEVKDKDGAYYYAGGKYTELEDVDSGAKYAAYGSKYVEVDTDDYYVDLTNGKVTDDTVREDDTDDAASALRKKIKDSDRYATTGSAATGFGDEDIATLTAIPGNKFGENWYATGYKPENNYVAAGLATGYTVYTDAKGNYIDADYNLGKIKVEATGVAVTVENTKDTYALMTATKDVSAKVKVSKALGQDKDNVYRYAEIAVNVGTATGSVDINGKSFPVVSGVVTLPVIQKISKAQDSDDIDDAKYAKSVTNYVISNDSANTQDGKALDYKALATTAGVEAKVIGGKLALLKVTNSASDDNVVVQTASLKSKNGYYYTDIEDSAKATAEFNKDLDKTAVDTDVDGNIYVIDGGYVKKFDGTDDWTKVYKVDGSFDGLSVYDKDNMVAWSQGDEVYSIIGGKTKEEEKVTPEVKAGWAQATDGTWTYVKADGTKATGWLQLGSVWYYLKADGVMATGWVLDGATWYFLNTNGSMATGWVQVGSDWYYLNANGSMAANTTVGGYVLGANGAWVR